MNEISQSNLADTNFEDLLVKFKDRCQEVIGPHEKLKYITRLFFQQTSLPTELIDPIMKMVTNSMNVSAENTDEIMYTESKII